MHHPALTLNLVEAKNFRSKGEEKSFSPHFNKQRKELGGLRLEPASPC
jgi:hypothetical protein